MSYNSRRQLIDLISPNTLGILWITEKNPQKNEDIYIQIDYILDSLLTKSAEEFLSKTRDHSKNNVFISENFGEKIFFCHFLGKEKSVALKQVNDVINLFSKDRELKKNVLIINQSKISITKECTKKFPQFSFVDVDLGQD